MILIQSVETIERSEHHTDVRVIGTNEGKPFNVITDIREGRDYPTVRDDAGGVYDIEFGIYLHEAMDEQYYEFMSNEMDRICGE